MVNGRSVNIREKLVSNSVRFLVQATKSLASSPHDALIQLCSGIELALKARLAHEHWSLVVDRPGSKELDEILEGTFKSVGFEEALDRVAKVTGKKWPEPDKRLLLQIAAHRNKVVHFYHEELEANDEHLRRKVTTEMCRAFNVLQRTLDGPWSDTNLFGFREKDAFEDALRKSRTYLGVLFEDLAPTLKAREAQGAKIKSCPCCKFAALLTGPPMECLVCGASTLATVVGEQGDYTTLALFATGEEGAWAAEFSVIIDGTVADEMERFAANKGYRGLVGRYLFYFDQTLIAKVVDGEFKWVNRAAVNRTPDGQGEFS